MSPELHERIKAEFPELFSNLRYGLDVSDTWYDVIRYLCLALQSALRALQAEHPDTPLNFSLLQVKQKFGDLRVYWCASNEMYEATKAVVSPLINAAYAEASTRCEFCSAPAIGRFSNEGYVVTACRQHGEGDPIPADRPLYRSIEL